MKLINETLDGLTLIITKPISYAHKLPEGGYVHTIGKDESFSSFETSSKMSLINKTKYFKTENHEVHLEINRGKPRLDFKGSFFLGDYKPILNSVIEEFKKNNFYFHSTQTDYSFDFVTEKNPWDIIHEYFQVNDLKYNTNGQAKNKPTWVRYLNSNFELVCYKKDLDIKEIKTNYYIEKYKEKIGDLKDIVRIEFRILNKKPNEEITSLLYTTDFELIKEKVIERAERTIKIRNKFKKLIQK